MDFLNAFFSDTFLPHGYCFQFRPDILWLNVISDLLIAAAYFSIPIALLIFVQKRRDFAVKRLFILFALFITLCGISHAFAIYTIWHASYAMHGVIKAATAIISLVTAFFLFANLGKILRIPTMAQLERAIHAAADEQRSRERLELEQKGEAIFKFATELIPTGLLVIDNHQNIVVANQALAELFGYERSELVGQDLSCLLGMDPEHHRALVKRYMDNPSQDHKMAAGRVVQGRHKSGSMIEIQINLSVHEYESERHTFATVSDFGSFSTEKFRFDENANRLKRAISASNDGIFEWNVQSNAVWFSNRFLQMIGKSQSAVKEFELWRRHIHPAEWGRVKNAIDMHLGSRGKFDVTYRGLGERGEYEWFHTRGDTLFDDEGAPVLMSGTLTNINRIRELEDKLEEKSRFLDQVLQSSLTGVYIYDIGTQSNIYINDEYTRLTGYTLSDLQGAQFSFKSLFHPDDQSRVFEHFRKLESGGNGDLGLGIEYRFRHKDGSWHWFYSRDSIFKTDDSGHPTQMLGACFDISELKQRIEAVRR